jgi:hypothetical protein
MQTSTLHARTPHASYTMMRAARECVHVRIEVAQTCVHECVFMKPCSDLLELPHDIPRYYPLDISFFKSSLDSHLLALLWNKYWISTLSSSPLIGNIAPAVLVHSCTRFGACVGMRVHVLRVRVRVHVYTRTQVRLAKP